jgi:hypothetical protein
MGGREVVTQHFTANKRHHVVGVELIERRAAALLMSIGSALELSSTIRNSSTSWLVVFSCSSCSVMNYCDRTCAALSCWRTVSA